MRGIGFLVLVSLAAAAGLWAGGVFRHGRGAVPGTVESDLVPGNRFPAAEVIDEAGNPHDLGRLAADGAVVMFLAADCGACGLTLEHWGPALADEELAGLAVLGVTSDPPAGLERLRAKGARFPLYRDPGHQVGRRLGVSAVPFVVVVAPGGVIRERWIGHRDDVDFARIRRLTGG